MKRWFVCAVFLWLAGHLYAGQIYNPAWGFRLDLPAGYEYTGGDGESRFSFQGPKGARFDLRVYIGLSPGEAGALSGGESGSVRETAADIGRRLGNQGETSFFQYRDKAAALIELNFSGSTGWGLCVELAQADTKGTPPLLLALSYAPAASPGMDVYHLSALDSIIPSDAERRHPGAVTEFAFPRGAGKRIVLANTGLSAVFREHDAEAAQALVDREFALLRNYLVLDNWQEAWSRFYRAIFRDSWDRVADALFQLERSWNAAENGGTARHLAEQALAFVQGFTYERDSMGSDFVNLVSAVTEGRGDCDSRSMLWAMALAQANIPAAIMVSREYSHAMGLADIPGAGARFEAGGIKWLVAETTAPVGLGLIGKDRSTIESWLGILFE
jgi:hypothetical protein